MVVSRGYFSHASSRSKNVAFVRRVTLFLVELDFGHVSFLGEYKNRVPREKPLKARKRTNNKLFPSIHTCQLSWIIQESPGYRTDLPLSCTGHYISRMKSSFVDSVGQLLNNITWACPTNVEDLDNLHHLIQFLFDSIKDEQKL